MTFFKRLRSHQPLPTAAAIRHRIRSQEAQRQALIDERQSLAPAELCGDAVAEAQRAALDLQIAESDRALRTLYEALPAAVQKEDEEHRRERSRLIDDLRAEFAARLCERDNLLRELQERALPALHEMTALRMLSRECSDIAYALAAATGERFATTDALAELRSSMHERHLEFESRWMRTRPTERPDFSDRPWRRLIAALQRVGSVAWSGAPHLHAPSFMIASRLLERTARTRTGSARRSGPATISLSSAFGIGFRDRHKLRPQQFVERVNVFVLSGAPEALGGGINILTQPIEATMPVPRCDSPGV